MRSVLFRSVRQTLLMAVALVATGVRLAAASDLDTVFDADARLFGIGQAVAVQADGKLVVGGQFSQAGLLANAYVARFNTDGSADTSFGPGANLNGRVRAVAVQTDGKIIIGGNFTTYGATSRPRIARLNADGTLDATFAPGTGFDDEVLDLVLQSDGKIVVVGRFTTFAGTSRNRVARLNTDGTLDATFTPGTGANGVVWDVALQSDGKPVIVGEFTSFNGNARNRIARLTTAGAPDTAIAFTGGANQNIYAVAIDSSGRFVIGGLFTTWNGTARKFIARLTTAGAVDATFDPGTTSFDDVVGHLAVDSAGRVVVTGYMTSFAGTTLPMRGVARLTAAGAVDAGFAPVAGDFAITRERYVEALAVGPNDSVIVVGSHYATSDGAAGVAWLTAAGAKDPNFNPGRGLTFEPQINAVRPGRDGAFYVAGEFDWIGGAPRSDLARFLPTGRIDPAFVLSPSFFRGAFFNAPVLDVAEMPSGNVWAFGGFTKYGLDLDRLGAARFSSTGFPDGNSLSVTGGVVRRALPSSDGKLTLAGTFTTINGTARAKVARVADDAALDTTFVPGTGPAGGEILDASLDSTGRLLVAGSFTSFSGTNESFLVRLGTTGAVDTAFAGNTAVSALVNSVRALPNGQAVIGGIFSTSGGYAVNGVDRLNADGTSDSTFNPGTGANSYVYAAVPAATGRIGLAGAFTAVQGQTRPGGLARLASGGAVDGLFATSTLVGGYANDLLELPDGKLLVRGSFTGVDGVRRSQLARFHAAPARRGASVSALNGSTLVAGDVRAVVPMADGGFVLGGEFTSAAGSLRNRVVKLGVGGLVDENFSYTSGFNGTVHGGLAEPGGGAVLWGAFASYNGAGASGIVRILANGTRDTGFAAPTFNSTVHAVLRQPDGRYLVAGAFTSADATTVGGLVRLNANGSIDTGFNAGTGANGTVLALARAEDGSIFAGGGFTSFAGMAAPGVVKLTAAGARVGAFNPGSGGPSAGVPVRALALQADGKLVVGGSFTTFNGVAANRILRLNADGSRDATFLNGFGADAAVNALALQADGRLYVAGAFAALGGGEHRGLARIGTDGRIDPVFDVGVGANDEVLTVVLLSDGRVAVAGKFTTFSGVARNRFTLLFGSDEGVPVVTGDSFQTVEVDPGQGFTLSLGAPVAGLNYQWYRDGVLLPGATGSVYTVASAGLADLGTYTTVVSNGAGEYITQGTKVVVKLAPVVTSAPQGQSVGYGAGVTFSVTATGPGPFTYQWYRNGTIIGGETGSSLTLSNVGDTDFGSTFYVRITNDYGTFDTTPVTLAFDPTAVPGALVRAFPANNPTFTSPVSTVMRTPGGQYYVGDGNRLLRLNADGSTDTTFAPSFTYIVIDRLALQSDGKLVIAGYLQPTGTVGVTPLLRLLPNGAVDPTFNPPAISLFSIEAMALQADGKVVIGGSFTAVGATTRRYLARLNTDGSLDTTFAPIDDATGPNTNGYVSDIIVQGSNLIVTGAFTTYRNTTVNRVVRLTSTNTVDGTFTGGTRADGSVDDILALSSGKLIIRGAFKTYNGVARNQLARLNADGSLDTTFDFGAGATMRSSSDTPSISAVAESDNGTLIVTGTFDAFSDWPSPNRVRLTATGAIDTQWAPPQGNIVTLLPSSDGLMFVGGYLTLPGLTGTQYFGRLLGGTYPPQPPAFVTQPQGSSYAYPAGSRRNLSALATGPGTLTFQWYRNGTAVADSTTIKGATTPMLTLRSLRVAEAGNYTLRVTSSTQGAVDSQPATVNVAAEGTGPGSLDLTWAADQLPNGQNLGLVTLNSDGTAFGVGRFYNGNDYTYFVSKFDANGLVQPAAAFAQGTGFNGGITGVAQQADGRVVVAGNFTTALGVARNSMARLTAAGALDTTFNPAPSAPVSTLVQQADGKLLVGGSFTTIAGASRAGVARLLATGAIDTGFVPGAHGLSPVKKVVVASDGKIYLLGANTTTFTDDVVRLTSAGALDGTFTRITAAYYSVNDFVLDGSGRVVVAGSFTQISGQTVNRLARFTSAGALDTTFGSGRSSGAANTISRVTVGPDGYYYLALDTSGSGSYDGFNLGPLVRLDASGRIDPNFPAATAGRIDYLSEPAFAWLGDKLVVSGFISGLARGEWIRLNTTGGAMGAPVLAGSSGDRTIVEGLGVSLYARFTGSGPFTYVWRLNGTIISGATGPQLLLTGTTAADAGVYTVTATNGSGSQVATMNLGFLPADPLSPTAGISLASNFNGSITELVRLSDGSALVAGSFLTAAGVNSPAIAKIKADGTLDAAFAAALPFATNSTSSPVTLAVESDGRILLHGSLQMSGGSTAYLVRLNATGSLAGALLTSTNTTGQPAAMVLQADGKIVLAGSFSSILGQSRAGLARLLANGTLDPAYQSGGLVSNGSPTGMIVDGSSRVLLAGNFSSVGGVAASGRVVRLNTDGTLDATFAANLNNTPGGFYRAGDGRIFAFGNALTQLAGQSVPMVQFNDDGSVNPTFIFPSTTSVVTMGEDALGRLYVSQSGALSRLLPGGWLDRSVTLGSTIHAMAPAGDRLLVAGGSQLGSINSVTVPGLAYLALDADNTLAVAASPATAVTASEGGTVTLRTGVRGPAGTTYQWFRNGIAVEGATSAVLVLNGVSPAASGSYTLVATSGGSQVTTTASQLTVTPNLAQPGEVDLAWGAGQTVSGVNGFVANAAGQTFLYGAVQINGGVSRTIVGLGADGLPRSDFTVSPRLTGSIAIVVVQPDGKLLVGGFSSGFALDGNAVGLVRLNADGSIDDTFTTGLVSSNGSITQLLVLGNGQILASGGFTTYGGVSATNLVRLSATGVMDGTFANSLSTSPFALLPAPGGKIWVIGQVTDSTTQVSRPFTRLNTDGTPDTGFTAPVTFGINGMNENLVRAAAAPDGGFYLLTRVFSTSFNQEYNAIRRVTPQGVYDTNFQPGVFARDDSPATALLNDLTVDAAGRLVVVGQFTRYDDVSRNAVVRLLADGRPDLSFGTPLPVLAGQVASLSRVFTAGNRVLVYGNNLANYGGLTDRKGLYALRAPELAAGAFPVAMGDAPAISLAAYDPLSLSLPVLAPTGAAIQWYRNGDAIPGATATSFRLRGAGPADAGNYHATVQTAGGLLSVPAVTVSTPALGYSGALGARNALLNIEGVVRFAVKQPDGKVLVVSDGAFVNGAGPYELFRLNADGSFAGGLPTQVRRYYDSQSPVQAAVVDADGRIYLGGSFDKVDGYTRNRLVRLLANGTVDTTWDAGTGPNSTVNKLALTPDGKLIAGGGFSQVNGVARQYLARFGTDGVHDTTFVTGTSLNNVPAALLVQSDGRVIVGGNFTTYNGGTAVRLIRLETTGTLDTTFAPAPNAAVNTLLALADGRLVAGGAFSTIGGVARTGLAYLSATGAVLETTLNYATGYTSMAEGSGGSFFALNTSQVQRFSGAGTRDTVFTNANGYRGNFTNANSTPQTVNPASLTAVGDDLLVAGPFAKSGVATRNGLAWLAGSDSLAPVITSAPVNATLPAGGTVNWFVSAAATTGTLTYTWTKVDGTGVLSTTSTLARSNVTLADAGTYRVVVSNGEGTATATVQLTVIALAAPTPGSPLLAVYAPTISSPNSLWPAGGGKWWVVANGSLRRLQADGSVDADFVAPTLTGGSITQTWRDPVGRIYITGSFTAINGQTVTRLARLSADGVFDPSFVGPFGGLTDTSIAINAMAFASDGSIYVGGRFTGLSVGGRATNGLVRLLANGTVDTAFDPLGGISVSQFGSEQVTALAVQPDGRLLVGGSFTAVAGSARKGLVRLLASGALDAAFNNLDISTVRQIAVQPDGRLLVGGDFGVVDGMNRARLARLSADGVVDPTFAVSGVTFNGLNSFLLRSDGRIVVFGLVLENNVSRARVVQLLPDGAVDPAFDYLHAYNTNTTGTTGTLSGGIMLPDGNLLVVGNFSYVDAGIARSGLVLVMGTPLAPTIVTPPAALTAAGGSEARLAVVVTGTAPFTYVWKRGGEVVEGATAAELVFNPVTVAQAGDYTVTIANSTGSVTSAATTLTVTQLAQTITFSALPDVTLPVSPITLSATSSSGLPVSFQLVSGPATLSGATLSVTSAGVITVRAAQAGDAAYTAASAVERAFTATAALTGFESWQADYFTEAELADPAKSGPAAIYGQDGLTNLLKYALGLNPKVNATAGLPEVSTSQTEWIYTYTRPTDRSDLSYAVEFSTNLSIWSTTGVTHELVSTSGGTQTWRARYPLASAANVFFRLRVTQP